MTQLYPEFQIFIKPVGSRCNLNCHYCYYVGKKHLNKAIMSDDILEKYIIQHIEASREQVINFSWHGGEPTLAGIPFFRKVVRLQNKYKPAGRKILNGIQTNGTMLNEEWCSFLASEKFVVGLSIDGPEKYHDSFRVTKDEKPTFAKVLESFYLLKKYKIFTELLCVVHSGNVGNPLEVYRFFKMLGVEYITFLPLVERLAPAGSQVSISSVPSEAFGTFLCEIFDEWVEKDIGRIKVQIFEEAARTAFNQEHSLCVFTEKCGRIPVMEHNGDFYSCDHYVNENYFLGNIKDVSLSDILGCPEQEKFGQDKAETLPRYCLSCEVKAMCNGECPKNRFIDTPDGEPGLNYLCDGYRKFFLHCKPFVDAISAAWRKGS